MFRKATSIMLLMASCAFNVHAATPWGEWTLKEASDTLKDYSLRIDVDPGEKYDLPGMAPSSVNFSEKILFNLPDMAFTPGGGSLGLTRSDGVKRAYISLLHGVDAKAGALPVVKSRKAGEFTSLNGPFDWKVGHKYRFRVQESPRSRESNWWLFTLADLTTGTDTILGEIRSYEMSGIFKGNKAVMEYSEGPWDCATLRHSHATMGQIRSYFDYWELEQSRSFMDGKLDKCAREHILPGMMSNDYDSSSKMKNGTLTLIGDQWKGLHRRGVYASRTVKGMMFATDPSEAEPYIYEAVRNGISGPFPEKGKDNVFWKSIGIGYPIINDLRMRNQRVYEWEERKNPYVKIGDYFIYHNPYNNETEYFKLKDKNPWYFPIDKSDNDDWQYVGRYPKQEEALWSLVPEHLRNEENPIGKKGWVFKDVSNYDYYILRNDGRYGAFPAPKKDNQWWQYLGEFR